MTTIEELRTPLLVRRGLTNESQPDLGHLAPPRGSEAGRADQITLRSNDARRSGEFPRTYTPRFWEKAPPENPELIFGRKVIECTADARPGAFTDTSYAKINLEVHGLVPDLRTPVSTKKIVASGKLIDFFHRKDRDLHAIYEINKDKSVQLRFFDPATKDSPQAQSAFSDDELRSIARWIGGAIVARKCLWKTYGTRPDSAIEY